MTVTLTPEIEQAVEEAARQQSTTAQELVLKTLETNFLVPAHNGQGQLPGPTLAELAAMPHAQRVYAIMGSSAHLGPSRLREDREEERAREERRQAP